MTAISIALLSAGFLLFFALGLACGYLIWSSRHSERRSERRALRRANRIAENLAPRRPYPSRLYPDDPGYIASIDN